MDRFTWAIVGGVVALVIAGLASVSLLQRPAGPPDLSTPDGVVRAYVVALDEGHPEQAWDLLTPGAQAGTTRDEYIRRASVERGTRRGRIATEETVTEGQQARVELSRTYDGGGGFFGGSGYATRSTVRLERDGGGWRISVPPDPYLLDRPGLPPVTVQVTVVAGQTPSPAPSRTP